MLQLVEALKREVPDIHISAVEVPSIGLCIRYSPLDISDSKSTLCFLLLLSFYLGSLFVSTGIVDEQQMAVNCVTLCGSTSKYNKPLVVLFCGILQIAIAYE